MLAFGQAAPPSLNDVFKAVTNVQAIAPAAFVLADVARSSTDWSFTGPMSGRVYHVSAAKETAVAGVVVGVALVVRHLWPKTAKYVDTALLLGAGACAGKAYANTMR